MAKMSSPAPVKSRAQREPAAPSAQAAPAPDTATGLVAMGDYHYARSVVQRRSNGQDGQPGHGAPHAPDASDASDLPDVPGAPAAPAPAPINRTGLPDGLKAGVEALSGVNLDGVKVHYRSAEPAQRQAHAYAQGAEIHLAAGQERHLPHEAWHLAQQAQGRVRPTRQLNKAIPVNDDIQLEREADRMGDAALRAGTPAQRVSSVHARRAMPPGPQASVMQGVFTYEGAVIGDKTAATRLATALYETLSGNDADSGISLEDFTAAVEELALYGDHGALSDPYFQKLLAEGPIRETFSFETVGRRLETRIQDTANFPPKRSSFHALLAQREQLKAANKSTGGATKKRARKRKSPDEDGTETETDKTDLSYTDLNTLLVGALQTIGLLPKDEADKIIEDAVNAGLEHFNAEGNEAKLDLRFNTDIQLIVHHLLKYQTFNHGQLKDIPKNRDENAFRAFLVEQTKEIIRNAAQNLRRIVPPAPDLDQGGSLHDALPAPIDSNRGLAHSPFTGEIYKGVFKLSQGLLRDAYDRANLPRASVPASTSTSVQVADLRSHLNPAFFRAIENDTSTVIPTGGGKQYAKQHAYLPYDEGAESFDEAPTDSDWDPSTDTELYASSDDLERANKKRKTILNTVGTFVKIANQKAELDKAKPGASDKHERIRRGTDRRVKHLNRHYAVRFTGIADETRYLTGKRTAIETRVKRLCDERAACEALLDEDQQADIKKKLKDVSKINPAYKKVSEFLGNTSRLRANTKDFKRAFGKLQEELAPRKAEIEQYMAELDRGIGRLESKKKKLEDYYTATQVGDILRSKSANPKGWRRKNADVFGGLGEKGLDKLASGLGDDETLNVDSDEEEEKEPPRRNKRKQKISKKAKSKGKRKASALDDSEADDERESESEEESEDESDRDAYRGAGPSKKKKATHS